MGVTGMTAVAVCNAVERTAGVRPQIKWTNDLVLNGKKICGILTELAVEGETGLTQSLVIGAGVNVSHTPEDFGPEVSQMATSLAQEGCMVSRPALAAAMIEELQHLSDALGGDVSPWVEAYRRDCVTLGRSGFCGPAGRRRRWPWILTASSGCWSGCRTAARRPYAPERYRYVDFMDIRSEQV